MSSLIQELVAENQLLKEQLEALASQNQITCAAEPDAFELDTIELLKAEIERLQTELVDREISSENRNEVFYGSTDPATAEECEKLLGRLDDLLAELDQSDQRIAILEDLLRASEEATAAEREERRQLEAWVGDIEQRISDRESGWKAEIELLRRRLKEATEQRSHIDQSLASPEGQSGNDGHARAEIEGWRLRAAELQQQLADADRERLALNQKLQQQAANLGQTSQLDQELREERVKMAQERAEMARQRADLISLKAQLDQQSKSVETPKLEVENRMRAFRQHLREIHDQEQTEQPSEPTTLSSRIAQLWKKLEERW